MTPPKGLKAGGRALWTAINEEHDLDAAQKAQLEEACRQKDRCDRLHDMAAADGENFTRLAKLANETANTMKQLLAALRLPDVTGQRPQRRSARGAQLPTIPGGKVTSIDRARARKSG